MKAIIVAHPGHELRAYHWMERERPLYFCLTDGSGAAAASRMPSTTRLLEDLGATPGPVYGRYTDKEIYRLLLDGSVDVFVRLANDLATALVAADVDHVAGDAVEGFNPTHDVCRFLIDGAVEISRRRTGRRIENVEFVLDGPPDDCPADIRARATWLRLDDAALTRKIDSALAYAELRDEVSGVLERFGRQAFAVECLRPPTTRLMMEQFDRDRPSYERYGEKRVEAGIYGEVIRYREHVLPVWSAIDDASRA